MPTLEAELARLGAEMSSTRELDARLVELQQRLSEVAPVTTADVPTPAAQSAPP